MNAFCCIPSAVCNCMFSLSHWDLDNLGFSDYNSHIFGVYYFLQAQPFRKFQWTIIFDIVRNKTSATLALREYLTREYL